MGSKLPTPPPTCHDSNISKLYALLNASISTIYASDSFNHSAFEGPINKCFHVITWAGVMSAYIMPQLYVYMQNTFYSPQF